MLTRRRSAPGSEAPTSGGQPPRFARFGRTLPAATAAAIGVIAVAACSKDEGNQVTQPIAVGMSADAGPYYSDGQISLYQAMTEVKLPVRKPTQAETSNPAPKGTPYGHAPYLVAGDEQVEVRWVIANLDSVQHAVWLLVDPWNEFVRWKPGVTVVNDEETIPNFGYDKAYIVSPNSRLEGTLTPDDITEIATKLASVQNLLASPDAKAAASGMDVGLDTTAVCNNIFNPQNRSNSNDVHYTPWIPPVIAGLTGFDIGIRTIGSEGMAAGANVAVEVTVQVEDLNGNRMVAQDDLNAQQIGVPGKTLSPPGARF